MVSPLELHRAVKRRNIGRVQDLLREGAQPNPTDRAGYTPLMYALEDPAAPVELVQFLMDHGAALPETTPRYGRGGNILSIGLRSGDPLKAAFLLQRGEDPHYVRDHGYDALLDAAYSSGGERNPRLLDLLRILLARGVTPNAVSSYGESALGTLARFGRFDAVQLLLGSGADQSLLGWSPLHHAVALGSLDDVRRLVEAGAPLEARDRLERTPFHLAVQTGDLAKARLLVERGADFKAVGKGETSSLELAIECSHTPMLRWLIELGVPVESKPDCCITPLGSAVQENNAEAVRALIAAGADVDRHTRCGCALDSAQTREIALILLEAGANSGDLSYAGHRAILGLGPADDCLFDATPADFRAAPRRSFGSRNPEPMNYPFWLAMIRSGLDAFYGGRLAGGSYDDSPIWCAQRFGESLTLLPDGRAIQIGGEHEDYYDEDFCIYNDVFVHHPDGRIEIFGYPEDLFPPTDFHTATLIGDSIYIIGRLAYRGALGRATPVFQLDTRSLEIRPVEATGESPGWISRHRAALVGPHQIRVWGGKIVAGADGAETYEDNTRVWILDVKRRQWEKVE